MKLEWQISTCLMEDEVYLKEDFNLHMSGRLPISCLQLHITIINYIRTLLLLAAFLLLSWFSTGDYFPASILKTRDLVTPNKSLKSHRKMLCDTFSYKISCISSKESIELIHGWWQSILSICNKVKTLLKSSLTVTSLFQITLFPMPNVI